jgi:hypothetical protein
VRKKVISIGAILCGVAVLSVVVDARILTVGLDGTSENNNIQAAVDAAGPDDTILLADGIYTGPGNRGVRITKSLTIRGAGGPERCIIDCQGADRAFTVVVNEPNQIVFEGLTLQNGGNVTEGGAILFSGYGWSELMDCVIRDNRIINGSLGGGIRCLGQWQLEIRNCLIEGNRVKGVNGITDGWSHNTNGGAAFGGGIFAETGELIISDSSLIGNTCQGGDPGFCDDCTNIVYPGWATGGAICGWGSLQVSLQNCLVVGNDIEGVDEVGTGLSMCSGVIRNCTFSNPNQTYYGETYGSLYGFGGTIINSIIWKETIESSSAQVSYCHTSDFKEGVGNIIGDPLFVDPGHWDNNTFVPGDYHLRSQAGRWDPAAGGWVKDGVTSPCIDAGDPTDEGWKNELWPNGRRIDIGAYGGTAEASLSGNAIGTAADLNFDDRVDIGDFAILARGWMKDEPLLAADLTRDGRVGIEDLAVMAEEWMK